MTIFVWFGSCQGYELAQRRLLKLKGLAKSIRILLLPTQAFVLNQFCPAALVQRQYDLSRPSKKPFTPRLRLSVLQCGCGGGSQAHFHLRFHCSEPLLNRTELLGHLSSVASFFWLLQGQQWHEALEPDVFSQAG